MSSYKKCIIYLFTVVFVLYASALFIFSLFQKQIHEEIQNRLFESTDIITSQIDESMTATVSKLLDLLERMPYSGGADKIAEEVAFEVNSSPYFSSARLLFEDGTGYQISQLVVMEDSLAQHILPQEKNYFEFDGGGMMLNLTAKQNACRLTLYVDTDAILRDVIRNVKMEDAVLLPSDGPVAACRGAFRSLDAISARESSLYYQKDILPVHTEGKSLVAIYMPVHTLRASIAAVFDSGKIFAGNTLWNSIILCVSLLALVCFALGCIVLHTVIHRPLHKLVDAFADLDRGNLDVKIDTAGRSEFSYLFLSFNQMTEGLKNSIEINYRQVIRTQQAELKHLYLQVNPHFLHNCFSNISSLCACGDYALIKPFTQKLATYYRYITCDGETDIPFEAEYNHALDYIAIQDIRFGGRIHAEFTPPSELTALRDVRVPKLMIQPLIENSFKHALEFITSGGRLLLSVSLEGADMEIRMEDNGQVLEDERIGQLESRMRGDEGVGGIGLPNVYRRLKLYYREQAEMSLSRSTLGGLAVTILIKEAKKPC